MDVKSDTLNSTYLTRKLQNNLHAIKAIYDFTLKDHIILYVDNSLQLQKQSEEMEQTNDMDFLSPTSEDTIRNRLREFVLYGALEFNQSVATQILISMDRNNAKSCKGAEYIGKVVGASVTGAGIFEGTIPIGKISGKVSFYPLKHLKSFFIYFCHLLLYFQCSLSYFDQSK